MKLSTEEKLVGPATRGRVGRIDELQIAPRKFLMVDGDEEPGGKQFQEAIQVLYSLAYTIKFLPKRGLQPAGYISYHIPPLEGFYDDPAGGWHWTLAIEQPNFVTEEVVSLARAGLREATKPGAELVRLGGLEEGRVVQTLHLGPYNQLGSTIGLLKRYLAGKGMEISGKHHEIYLNDPRRVEETKIKTIVRYPVKPKV